MSLASAASAASVEGTWRTLTGTEINVQPCEAGYCGSLSWIVIPEAQAGLCKSVEKEAFAQLILDYNNVDPSQQTRPLLGATLLTLQPTSDPDAYTASVYNAEDGQTHNVLVWIVGGTTLRLGGACVGSLCAVTQDWPRVADRENAPDFTCDSSGT